MRPSLLFFSLLALLLMVDGYLSLDVARKRSERAGERETMRHLVYSLGLTDLAVATEARYTRHPAVSDRMAPFMDHPGAIEHFPTGSFWRPER